MRLMTLNQTTSLAKGWSGIGMQTVRTAIKELQSIPVAFDLILPLTLQQTMLLEHSGR